MVFLWKRIAEAATSLLGMLREMGVFEDVILKSAFRNSKDRYILYCLATVCYKPCNFCYFHYVFNYSLSFLS